MDLDHKRSETHYPHSYANVNMLYIVNVSCNIAIAELKLKRQTSRGLTH
jgi:hypothetical protein